MAWIIFKVFMEQKNNLFHRIQSVFQQKNIPQSKRINYSLTRVEYESSCFTDGSNAKHFSRYSGIS